MGVISLEEITRFGVSMESKLLYQFDELIKKKSYSNRSEAIRDLIRDFIIENQLEAENTETIGTITYVFNHEVREINDKLTNIQHKHYQNIISTMHVHLDKHNCLEIMVLKGTAKEITKIADEIISTKGVKHGKLVMTTTGKNL
ncbi:nickel-responsive transcriptional regulator NikR [Thermoanaerobacter sp. CM-CNRG TB177]|jgi:CopG family nickel-responsive transcriptional regulator|uniref:Putative nickel-responsive regulator n=2 Tax=Thermoanaerobacter TaxID=1754 RepID=D3T607_THEIA|nr:MULTISPECIES: nickel-responsive transcriptional regulator NikR [Thermoanaerobacter]ADD01538.1 transcriptional regulator NikR, CopG family [Thermoanaerobacter italicus Ab9]MDP9750988.1 CopG family nickel-responsive transcriptional regulator [Thermoanaerobacter pentosaceus]